MDIKNKKPERSGRLITVYLDEDEQKMLDSIMAVDVRNISDTMRYALRFAHGARFGRNETGRPQNSMDGTSAVGQG
jgi:hypothetical protein